MRSYGWENQAAGPILKALAIPGGELCLSRSSSDTPPERNHLLGDSMHIPKVILSMVILHTYSVTTTTIITAPSR